MKNSLLLESACVNKSLLCIISAFKEIQEAEGSTEGEVLFSKLDPFVRTRSVVHEIFQAA